MASSFVIQRVPDGLSLPMVVGVGREAPHTNHHWLISAVCSTSGSLGIYAAIPSSPAPSPGGEGEPDRNSLSRWERDLG